MPVTTPSLSTVATQENWYRSYQVTESALLAPEVFPDIIQRYGEQNFAIEGLTKKLGGEKYISNMEFRHSEQNFLHEVLQVGAHGAWGANAVATLTIAAAYDYTFPATAPAVPFVSTTQQTVTPLYAKQIIQFPDGTQAVVQSVTQSTGVFTCYPKVLGENIPATLTTDVIIILGNQVEEGADQNPSRDTQLIWYFNNMQNSNWTYKTTGNARAEKTWVKTDEGFVWYYYAQMNEMKRAKNERETTIVTNVKTTNTTFANVSGNETNISFEGLIPFIESYGNLLSYNLISFITLDDWNNLITTQIMPNVGAAEYAVYSSANVWNYKDQFIRAEMKQGGIIYNAFGGDSEQYVNFGFNSFCTSGHSFHWKHYDLFNHIKLLGAQGQPYQYMALGIPMDKTDQTVDWNDMTATKNVPQFMINYQKSPDGYNREWEEWLYGSADMVHNSTIDTMQVNARSTYGFEGFAPNRYFQVAKD